MNQYKLSFVKNEEKLSKAGKKYVALSVKIDGDTEDRWYNGLGNDFTKSWNVGDTVPLEIYEEEYQGKKYWKCRALSKTDMAMSQMEELTKRVVALEAKCGIANAQPGAPMVAPAGTSPAVPPAGLPY